MLLRGLVRLYMDPASAPTAAVVRGRQDGLLTAARNLVGVEQHHAQSGRGLTVHGCHCLK
jgi:hypothetical protein